MQGAPLFNKIYGCLMGVACGDAMGMPTAMMSPEAIRTVFPRGIEGFVDAPGGHLIHAGMVAGQVTDDTQQTLVLADAILEDGKVDPAGLAHRLLAWAEGQNAFASTMLGPSSLRALQALKDGKSVDETGKFGDTNGACMRIAPVGIVHMGNVETTVADVARACRATHNTNIAIAGASAVACAVGACIRGGQSLDEVMGLALRGAARGMEFGNPWIGASIARRTEYALHLLDSGRTEEEILRDLYELIGAGVAITETVPTCLALVKFANGDPVKTIRLAANLGGDADTIASIAGGVAGAYAGIEAFPQSYVKTIEDVNNLHLDTYAHRLAAYVEAHLGATYQSTGAQ